MKKFAVCAGILTVALSLLCGCVTVPKELISAYTVNIDSYSTKENDTYSFTVLPASQEISQSDIQFREFEQYVIQALTRKGNAYSKSIDKADQVILLSYSLEKPQTRTRIYTAPVYNGYYIVDGYTNSYSYETSTKTITLESVDRAEYQKNKTRAQIWKTNVISAGKSSDLRSVFPFLMAAAWPYLGTNTGGQIQQNIDEVAPDSIEFEDCIFDKKAAYGDLPTLNALKIENFTDIIGFDKSSSIEDAIAKLGTPTEITDTSKTESLTRNYSWLVPGKCLIYMVAGTQTKRIKSVALYNLGKGQNALKAYLETVGIKDKKLDAIGLYKSDILAQFGRPTTLKYGILDYYFKYQDFTRSVAFSCPRQNGNLCSAIFVNLSF